MRARDKLLINNGGTVLGSHSMPHHAAAIMMQGSLGQVTKSPAIIGSVGSS